MRIAFLSDIHGNSIALDAVLADIQRMGGVDSYWLIGDLIALGPDPIGVLERVTTLPHLTLTRGNTDRYTISGALPPVAYQLLERNRSFLPDFVTIAQSFGWTRGAITTAGWLPWIHNLPLEQRIILPDGSRLLAIHASPGQDDGDGIHPKLTSDQLRATLQHEDADIIIVGHTHWPLDIHINRQRVINLGSISNPLAPDTRASYVILEAEPEGYTIELRRVVYDHEAVIAAFQQLQHPSADFLIQYQRGQKHPSWQTEM